MPKNKGGRPPAITPTVLAKLTTAFELDMTVEEACTYAGISKDTYYRKAKTDQRFSDEMERARQFATAKARRIVIEKMEDDGRLALSYLERKRKEEFSPRFEQQVEVNSIVELIKQQEQEPSFSWEDSEAHLAVIQQQGQ
ncbi:hypothetical protein COU76_04760 [Candidatus Peregrinibacteria bacterium CG10_big_fil_rev_8_21_14_0_10_49_10]|nr:MAG: hypothetical protein COU76_04760 [Candidatus Peregrinibacteria bacterium CG10_big_fil_rev_8_21_14_0_10_49_10]